MKVEVFLSNCHLCEQTLLVLHQAVPPTARITVHRCHSQCCCEAGRSYDLYTVLPAVVVNGKVVHQGRLKPTAAEKLFRGLPESEVSENHSDPIPDTGGGARCGVLGNSR